MKIIKLTHAVREDEVYVNFDNVTVFQFDEEKKCTELYFISEEESFDVKENSEYIMKKLGYT